MLTVINELGEWSLVYEPEHLPEYYVVHWCFKKYATEYNKNNIYCMHCKVSMSDEQILHFTKVWEFIKPNDNT